MDFFPDDLNDSIESLPASLKDSLTKIQELDKSLLEIQQQNEQRCEQEIEEIKRKIESGEIKPGTLRNRKSRFSGSGAGLSRFRFSDQTFDEQTLCINIADQKVALATEAYDLVDERIRKLDQFMRNIIVVRQDGALDDDRITRSGRASKSRTEGDNELTVTAEPQPHMILDLPVDPNEPTFCICNEVSWGKMVACDNPHCKIEWFHFSCVEVTEQPKGKWYCPSCRPDCIVLERRKGK